MHADRRREDSVTALIAIHHDMSKATCVQMSLKTLDQVTSNDLKFSWQEMTHVNITTTNCLQALHMLISL